jgi:hypothetical protein
MIGDDSPMRTALTIVLMFLLAVCAYICSYFTLVRRGGSEMLFRSTWYAPRYAFSAAGTSGIASALFEPVHNLDRQFIRPTMWDEPGGLLPLLLADLGQKPGSGASICSEPNPQGGANGRQPLSSDTNRAPAAAASRRSP